MDLIPKDILIQIGKYLDGTTIRSLEKVSKALNKVTKSKSFWWYHFKHNRKYEPNNSTLSLYITQTLLKKSKCYTIGHAVDKHVLGHKFTTSIEESTIGFDNIVQVACSTNHIGLLTFTGELYMCGDNKYGQIGIPGVNYTTIFRKLRLPYSITNVSCGGYHTAFISNNELYVFGSNVGKTKIERPTRLGKYHNVTNISCGLIHTAFINNGELYTFGRNIYGQLGYAQRDVRPYRRPRKVSNFNNVVLVSCGNYYTAFITKRMEVYVFGLNNKGQLGIGSKQDQYTPIKVNLNSIINVSCSKQHTAFLTKNGEVYMTGDNKFGQLGIDINMTLVPIKLDIDNVSQVSCGLKHTGIIRNNELYLFGTKQAFYDGYGHVITPRKIDIQGIPFQIMCSSNYTGVLTAR